MSEVSDGFVKLRLRDLILAQKVPEVGGGVEFSKLERGENPRHFPVPVAHPCPVQMAQFLKYVGSRRCCRVSEDDNRGPRFVMKARDRIRGEAGPPFCLGQDVQGFLPYRRIRIRGTNY